MDVPARATDEDGGGVRAVERAIAVLRVFAAQRRPLSGTEIGQAVGLNKSTVHRFLRTLERADFVVQDRASKLYRLGLGLAELGHAAIESIEVTEIARPFLAELHARCGEAIHLGVIEEDEVVYVGKLESTDRSIRLNSRIGRRSPVHCTGLGKAMLAWMGDAEVSAIIARRGLQRYSATTITSPAALREHLALIRHNGYAVDDGEHNELVRCVAAPVFDRGGAAVAAVSVTTVALDTRGHRMRELAEMVIASTRRISEAMGWRAPSARAAVGL